MRLIPLVDLQSQYRDIKTDVTAAIERVLDSARLVLGPEGAAFEDEFAAFCRTGHAVAVSSGTSALHLALLAAGVGPGDEVVTVPFTFVATVAAIDYAGARPVFVDVDSDSLTMDPRRLEAAITSRTRAIMPVHLYGQPADMEPILTVARRHDLAVVEDACQAPGAEYRGYRAGSLGHLGCFSFHADGSLGAYGEGGAVTTSDSSLARRVRLLRDWGAERKYEHQVKGYNYRLSEIQAAVLRVKLWRLEAWIEARRAHARRYARTLGRLGGLLERPVETPGGRHVYQLYTVRARNRTPLRRTLERFGVQTAVHYPVPIHLQRAWAELGYRRGDFPVAERAAAEVLSLPMYPELANEDVDRVTRVLAQAARRIADRIAASN